MTLQRHRNEQEVLQRIADGLGDGNKTVTTAGSRVTLASATDCLWVLITANGANSGNIWVGGATVANGRGKQLVPLQDLLIEIDDLSKIYIDSTSDGDGVSYIYGTCVA